MLGMGLLVSLLIIVFAYSFHVLEYDLMEKYNQAELEHIEEQLRQNPAYELPQTANLQMYRSDGSDLSLPHYLHDLAPGYRGEVDVDGLYYFVMVSRLNDETLYVVSDISEFEQSENRFQLIILVSWSTLLALIFALSFLLSRNLLKPISDFADEIDSLQPEQRGHSLTPKYHGLEVGKIARAMERYFDKIDEYVERQNSFAAMASHELRTPLTIIQTSAELIAGLTDNRQINNQCNKIRRSSAGMNDMILALLAITRDQPVDRQETSPVRLHDAMHEAMTNQQPQIDLNRIEIENLIPPDTVLECNSALLAVVINNLLANAIKHSPKGLIRLTYTRHALSIQDNGEGLGTDDIDGLLMKGVAGENSGGYGLGLYITKLICDKQGWSLELRNANPGTLARVTFH